VGSCRTGLTAGRLSLGLKLETVSRTFSKFAEENIIEVRQRHLRILDTDALKRIVNSQQCQ
jgi:CRP/FNR family transcriptional regulator